MEIKKWDDIWETKAVIKWDALSEEIYQTLKNEVREIKGKRIIEAGCGNGRVSLRLALEGAEVTVVDYYGKLDENTRKQLESHGLKIKYIASAPGQVPFGGEKYDFAWNSVIMQRLTQEEGIAIVKELSAVSPEIHTFNTNGRSIFYTLGKWYAENNGRWTYGKENPIISMKQTFEKGGYTLETEYSIAHTNAIDFLDFIPGSDNVKNALVGYLQSLAVNGKTEMHRSIGGYLLYSKGNRIL